MTLETFFYTSWGFLLGLLLSFGNSFLRQYLAVKLLKTAKKTAIIYVSIFSLLRLAVILLLIYLTISYISKEMAFGALFGLVVHTILLTIKYTKKRNK
jgi:hypothetical protein